MELREIDILIATNIMGWSLMERYDKGLVFQDENGCEAGDIFPRKLPHYSSDIAAAWSVFERVGMGASCRDNQIRRIDGPLISEWRCSFQDDEGSSDATAHTAPLAICLAALKAKGIDTKAQGEW